MTLWLSKMHSFNTLKHPNGAVDRLGHKSWLSGTSSGFGDLWEKKDVFVNLCNGDRYYHQVFQPLSFIGWFALLSTVAPFPLKAKSLTWKFRTFRCWNAK